MDTKFHINPGSGTVSRCRASTKCPFGGESGHENHFDTPGEARSGFEKLMKSEVFPKAASVSSRAQQQSVPSLGALTYQGARELVLLASADHGRKIRTYLRLLNYGNYEMAKGLRQSLKDKDTVELVVSYNRLSSLVTDKKLSIEKMERWKREATVPIKAQSYGRRIVQEQTRLSELERSLETAAQRIESSKMFYSEKLAQHKASVDRLHSYQMEVASGQVTQVPLSLPMNQLPKSSKGALEGELKARSMKMLEDLNSRDHDRIVEAAKTSGNEYHIDSAVGYRKHSKKVEQLTRELSIVEADYAKGAAGHPMHTTVENLLKRSEGLQLTLDNEVRVRADYARRLELFRSEVKDDMEYNARLSDEVREIVEFGE
jgi:hypothetical protein